MKLLLLHGALGSTAQLAKLATQLSEHHEVLLMNFSGHGTDPATTGYSIPAFANDVLKFLAASNIKKIIIMGYSMGGYVAMYLAAHHPEIVTSVITLATKYQWTPEIATREIKMLDAGTITTKLPDFACMLEERHSGIGWKNVLLQTADMMTAMGQNNPLKVTDLAGISHPCLIMLGDKDKMVSLAETVEVFNGLPNAQLCILPGTRHPIEQLDVILVAAVVNKFLSTSTSS